MRYTCILLSLVFFLHSCKVSSLFYTLGVVSTGVALSEGETGKMEDAANAAVVALACFTIGGVASLIEKRKRKLQEMIEEKNKREKEENKKTEILPSFYQVIVLPKSKSVKKMKEVMRNYFHTKIEKDYEMRKSISLIQGYLREEGYQVVNSILSADRSGDDYDNMDEENIWRYFFSNQEEVKVLIELDYKPFFSRKGNHIEMNIHVYDITKSQNFHNRELILKVSVESKKIFTNNMEQLVKSTFEEVYKMRIASELLFTEKGKGNQTNITVIEEGKKQEEPPIEENTTIEEKMEIDPEVFVLTKPKKVRENAIAVIIGNKNYIDKDIPSVNFAYRDAEQMKAFLIQKYGFKEGNIIYSQDATLSTLNSIFGTKGDYKAKLYNYVVPNKSEVFIYYSGHGVPGIEDKKQYIAPADCKPSLIKYSAYSMETLYENLSKIPYKKLYVVIDACFSGMSAGGALIKNISPVFIKTDKKLFQDQNAMLFYSCKGEQVSSWYSERQHSLFSYYFFKALYGQADENKNKALSLKELKGYLETQIPYAARRQNNREQNPQIYGVIENEFLPFD